MIKATLRLIFSICALAFAGYIISMILKDDAKVYDIYDTTEPVPNYFDDETHPTDFSIFDGEDFVEAVVADSSLDVVILLIDTVFYIRGVDIYTPYYKTYKVNNFKKYKLQFNLTGEYELDINDVLIENWYFDY